MSQQRKGEKLFQSTFPHGERLHETRVGTSSLSFNPRSRTGNDSYGLNESTTQRRFQSTFPHGERRFMRLGSVPRVSVSIHVPARGTTFTSFFLSGSDTVSIHVPARGTTISPRLYRPQALLFQSTFPHGERLVTAVVFPLITSVSIHVPARGTTT